MSFSIFEWQRQALGVETITALTLFGGHDHGTVLELAIEAVRTGRVRNLPLQYRQWHTTTTSFEINLLFLQTVGATHASDMVVEGHGVDLSRFIYFLLKGKGEKK